tara:strand:+ start:711 stop:1322 length:612 start_codon:yes stop_codon:yes gene_type:complete
MELLHLLFPGLIGFDESEVPSWGGLVDPWDVFNGDYSIKYQINLLLENGSEYYSHPTAKIADSAKIEGPAYIGPGAVIRHGAYLRAGSWICERAVVGNSSEIKNSVLLPGAKAPHFNYVGDSIVGFDANLGAGVKLSNVRNDRKKIRLYLDNGQFVCSGLTKLGAMIGDSSQLGCNSVTNPGTILPTGSMVRPNSTITGWFLD